MLAGSMVPGLTLNQRGADVFQQSLIQDFGGNYSIDISGTVDARSVRLTMMKLVNNNKFRRWNVSGTAIGTIQDDGTISGTISGTFQTMSVILEKFVDCTATDHQFRFVPKQ